MVSDVELRQTHQSVANNRPYYKFCLFVHLLWTMNNPSWQ